MNRKTYLFVEPLYTAYLELGGILRAVPTGGKLRTKIEAACDQ
jgi:hypothetical protein